MIQHEPRLNVAIGCGTQHNTHLTFTMFKGILPPRRAPSPEFTIVNPLVENGKENLPNPLARRPEAPSQTSNGKVAVAPRSTKATTTQDKSKHRKGDVPPHTAPATASTDREFDRLLVRACHGSMSSDHPALGLISISCVHRTICKSLPRSVQSSRAWSLPLRLPCSSRLTSSTRHQRPHVVCAACRAAVPSTLSLRPTRALTWSLTLINVVNTITLPRRPAPKSAPATPRLPPPNILVACRSTWWCRPGAQSPVPAFRHPALLPIWVPPLLPLLVARCSRPCSLSVC